MINAISTLHCSFPTLDQIAIINGSFVCATMHVVQQIRRGRAHAGTGACSDRKACQPASGGCTRSRVRQAALPAPPGGEAGRKRFGDDHDRKRRLAPDAVNQHAFGWRITFLIPISTNSPAEVSVSWTVPVTGTVLRLRSWLASGHGRAPDSEITAPSGGGFHCHGWQSASGLGTLILTSQRANALPRRTITLALARGIWRMARQNALIERLSAVDTLGAMTVILTDKTGTLKKIA